MPSTCYEKVYRPSSADLAPFASVLVIQQVVVDRALPRRQEIGSRIRVEQF
jgi:hypothetical protein